MTDAITKSEYDEEIDQLVERIIEDTGEYDDHDDPRTAVYEYAEEDVQHHNWFARDYYDGSLYGAIVDHVDADVARHSDWGALIETNDPMKTLKRLARVGMEADVIDRALERINDE